jgi:processive 1,2-diacylglycerol beta-glucosyltransferase
MNVIIFTVSIGGGHLKAAQSIKEEFELKHPCSKVLIVDTLKYINPAINKLVVGGYLSIVRKTPKIYGKIYEMCESNEDIYDFSNIVNKLLSRSIKSLICKYSPSVIICTHPFPLQMVSNLKRKSKITIPLMAILTDFVPHPILMHTSIDAYVVAHEYMKYSMLSRKIPEQKIYPYGIPISKNFLQPKNKRIILEKHGLEDKLTFLIMGGSLGFGQIRYTFKSLLECSKDFQIIAITGNNSKLKRQLEKSCLCGKKKVIVIEYTNDVSDFMAISDFLITKPGGMTISEALSIGLPMFLISPIPGHEEGNANFLLNIGAAARIFPNDNVDNVICQILDNPLRLAHMKEMATHLAKPNAGNNVVCLLEKLISNTGSE